MNIYHYAPETGLFLEAGLAEADPMEDGDTNNPEHWLIPAYATHITPPKIGDNQQALWDGQAWKVQDIPPAPTPPPEPTLAERKAAMAALIKAEAGRRILTRYPEWIQRNMTARSMALLDKGSKNWDANDQQDAQTNRAAWAWIESIRSRSDTLETQVQAMNAETLDTFDPGDDTHWSTQT